MLMQCDRKKKDRYKRFINIFIENKYKFLVISSSN